MSGDRRSRAARLATASVCAAVAGGCGPDRTRFVVVDHRADGETAQYFEEFDECYYSRDADGRFDVVARRVGRSDDDAEDRITQIVHLHGIWRSVPGRTHAEGTMINATACYMIISGIGGASFEGGGFVLFHENRERTMASGRLESAKLTPGRRLGNGRRLLERAELQGDFKARRNRPRVVRMLSEARRLFGPLPVYQHPPTEPDVL